jgi:hypothetical protein
MEKPMAYRQTSKPIKLYAVWSNYGPLMTHIPGSLTWEGRVEESETEYIYAQDRVVWLTPHLLQAERLARRLTDEVDQHEYDEHVRVVEVTLQISEPVTPVDEPTSNYDGQSGATP